jgi:D-threo-aldose 1-dehydrogenase
MRIVKLGQTELKTSRLGFGCVKLTAQTSRQEAVRSLEHAFAEGITHFDVARAYGFGRAESIVGEFLRGKRDKVTVASKFGLLPPQGMVGSPWIVNTARKILGPFPGLLRRAKARAGSLVQSGAFDPQAARLSLETSLRELRTDYVDLLLLHEATVNDARSEALLELLSREQAKGKIKNAGIASDFEKVRGVAEWPGRYSVLQFNDNVLARNRAAIQQGCRMGIITHSIFQPADALRGAIQANPTLTQDYQTRIGADVRRTATLRGLLLSFALRGNQDGTVLFASTSPKHITANVREAEESSYNEQQVAAFVEFADRLAASENRPDSARPAEAVDQA